MKVVVVVIAMEMAVGVAGVAAAVVAPAVVAPAVDYR